MARRRVAVGQRAGVVIASGSVLDAVLESSRKIKCWQFFAVIWGAFKGYQWKYTY